MGSPASTLEKTESQKIPQRVQLKWAIGRNDLTALRRLVGYYEMDVSQELALEEEGGLQQMPPLHYAVTLGRRQIATELLMAGCDVNQKTTLPANCLEPLTALHLACQHRDKKVSLCLVKELLANGADVNAGRRGFSALYFAARQGHGEVVRVLCAHGADVNEGIERRAREGSQQGPHVSRGGETGVSAKDICDNVQKRFTETPLHSAALHGHCQVVRILCANRADVNSRNACGDAPMHCAVAGNEINTLLALCKLGADVNQGNDALETPLHYAVNSGNVDVVRALCKRGASINIADVRGNTALHLSAERGHLEIVEYFLSKSECNDVKNNEGHAVLQHAICRGLEDRQREKFTWFGTAYYWMGICEMLDLVETLIRAGWQPEPNPMTMLLEQMKVIFSRFSQYESEIPMQRFRDCLCLLLASGCFIEEKAARLMKCPALQVVLKSADIVQYVHHKARPSTLQHLCRVAIRTSTHKPLTGHLSKTGLPPALEKYILLENGKPITLKEPL